MDAYSPVTSPPAYVCAFCLILMAFTYFGFRLIFLHVRQVCQFLCPSIAVFSFLKLCSFNGFGIQLSSIGAEHFFLASNSLFGITMCTGLRYMHTHMGVRKIQNGAKLGIEEKKSHQLPPVGGIITGQLTLYIYVILFTA